jgi:hypothetical protein
VPRKANPKLFTDLADQRVMTVAEFSDLNAISIATAKRLLRSGEGPRVLRLSTKRIGVRVIDNREWQEARMRS